MRVNKLILGLMLMPLIVGSVSAITPTVSYPTDQFSYTRSYWESHCYVNMTANISDLDYLFNLTIYISSPVLYTDDDTVLQVIYHQPITRYTGGYDTNGDGYTSFDDIDLDGDGTQNLSELSLWSIANPPADDSRSFNMNVDFSNTPWNNCNYTIGYQLVYYHNQTEYQNDSTLITFSQGEALEKDYYFSIRNFDPPNMDFEALRVVGDGCYFEAISNTGNSTTLYLFVTSDNAGAVCGDQGRFMRGYGTRTLWYDNDSLHSASGLQHEVDWMWFKVKNAPFEAREHYYVYIGFKHQYDGGSNVFTADNTEITTDNTVQNINFTVNGVSDGSRLKEAHSCDANYDKDHLGTRAYFESFPCLSPECREGTGWTPDDSGQGTVGDDVNAYGVAIGLPWFGVMMGLIIVLIFTLLPLSFSLKWGINIPNFTYAITSFVGWVIGYAVGFFELWMLFLVGGVYGFLVSVKYKDYISRAGQVINVDNRFSGLGNPIATGLAPIRSLGRIRRGKKTPVATKSVVEQRKPIPRAGKPHPSTWIPTPLVQPVKPKKKQKSEQPVIITERKGKTMKVRTGTVAGTGAISTRQRDKVIKPAHKVKLSENDKKKYEKLSKRPIKKKVKR